MTMKMNSPQSEPNGTAIVQQTQLEFETLGHIKKALQGAIQADIAGNELPRKMASVRFVTSSLQTYVERLFALEEHNGYMTELTETHPQLLRKIYRLRSDHDTLRESLRRMVTRLELFTSDDAPAFDAVCKELLDFIAQLGHHTHAETKLLEDAYLQDTGGEGGM